LTELLVELKDAIDERQVEILLQFELLLGRFKHVFLAVSLWDGSLSTRHEILEPRNNVEEHRGLECGLVFE
jgi:hypothetical protein